LAVRGHLGTAYLIGHLSRPLAEHDLAHASLDPKPVAWPVKTIEAFEKGRL
jgi:hypothetical protein